MAAKKSSLPQNTPPNPAADNRSKIAEWLATEGFRPVIEENLIVLKYEGTKMSISYDSEKSAHTLVVGCSFERLEAFSTEMYLAAANRANAEVFAAKAFVGETDISFAVESCLAEPVRDFPLVGLDLLTMIKRSIGVFFAVIEEICSDSAEAGKEIPDDEF